MSEKPAKYIIPGQENVVRFPPRAHTTSAIPPDDFPKQPETGDSYYLTPAEIEALRADAQRSRQEIRRLIRERKEHREHQ